MPIVDLARRLEDAGVAALTIHCRTAQMGHTGAADWSWAERAREVVAIPVIVNGDVRSADDAVRALARDRLRGRDGRPRRDRAPVDLPRGARAARRRGRTLATPDDGERLALYRALLVANVAARGEKYGVEVTRRHLKMLGPALNQSLRLPLCAAKTFADVCAVLDGAAAGCGSQLGPTSIGALAT